jgi:hypothetical protein
MTPDSTHNNGCGPLILKRWTPHSTLSATQLTQAPTKHVTITSLSLPIYSTLKFTYFTGHDRRPHSDTQTELNIGNVTKCKQIQHTNCKLSFSMTLSKSQLRLDNLWLRLGPTCNSVETKNYSAPSGLDSKALWHAYGGNFLNYVLQYR